jgi:hypothetical protein
MTSRVASAALAIAIALSVLAATTTGTATGSAAAAEGSSYAAKSWTKVAFTVSGCEGCRLRLTQARDGRKNVWQSKSRTVTDGLVTWRVPTSRTRGLSVTVLAPWDGGAGYVPTVAFRYAGTDVGDTVTNATAKSKKRASACWAGTTRSAVTVPITVVRADGVTPTGQRIKTPRAFASVTQRWDQPMERVRRGISGTQDVVFCG